MPGQTAPHGERGVGVRNDENASALLHDRVVDLVGAGERTGVRRGGRRALGRAAGLDGEDRLRVRPTPRDFLGDLGLDREDVLEDSIIAFCPEVMSLGGINQLRIDPQPDRPEEAHRVRLGGEVLEGGENLDDVLRRLEAIEENVCLSLLEMALDIEYSAFDLYRTMAEQTESAEARSAFLSIAQAEKTHMQTIARAVSHCPELGGG